MKMPKLQHSCLGVLKRKKGLKNSGVTWQAQPFRYSINSAQALHFAPPLKCMNFVSYASNNAARVRAIFLAEFFHEQLMNVSNE